MSERDGSPQLYLANADGTGQLRLTREGKAVEFSIAADGTGEVRLG